MNGEILNLRKDIERLSAELVASNEAIEQLGKRDLQSFIDAHASWANQTFKDQDKTGILEHLKEEVQELIESPSDRHEFADCFGLLIRHWYAVLGGDAITALEACYEKLEICKGRKYGKPDKNGVVHHIRQSKGMNQ